LPPKLFLASAISGEAWKDGMDEMLVYMSLLIRGRVTLFESIQ
jgi:hypothetical protein